MIKHLSLAFIVWLFVACIIALKQDITLNLGSLSIFAFVSFFFALCILSIKVAR